MTTSNTPTVKAKGKMSGKAPMAKPIGNALKKQIIDGGTLPTVARADKKPKEKPRKQFKTSVYID